MAVPIQSQAFNPVSGVFGNGQVQIFSSSGTWTVPPGVAKVRARCFGAGGGAGGGGGGFAMRTVYELTGVASIAVTVGITSTTTGGTSSFGAYVSATGGAYNASAAQALGGVGVGGDINTNGGAGWGTAGGGGVGNLFGDGGSNTISHNAGSGASGAGAGNGATNYNGGNGIMGSGGSGYATNGNNIAPTSGMQGGFSIDYIGTGGGGGANFSGINGGGAGQGSGTTGGYPGGGGGGNSPFFGGGGMVIVEW